MMPSSASNELMANGARPASPPGHASVFQRATLAATSCRAASALFKNCGAMISVSAPAALAFAARVVNSKYLSASRKRPCTITTTRFTLGKGLLTSALTYAATSVSPSAVLIFRRSGATTLTGRRCGADSSKAVGPAYAPPDVSNAACAIASVNTPRSSHWPPARIVIVSSSKTRAHGVRELARVNSLFSKKRCDLCRQSCRAARASFQRAVQRHRVTKHFSVAQTDYLRMSRIAHALRHSGPRPRHDTVAEHGLCLVVNFMPQRHPRVLRSVLSAGQRVPVCNSNVLHP